MIALLARRSFRLKAGGIVALALAAGVVVGGGDDDVPAPKAVAVATAPAAPVAAASRAAAAAPAEAAPMRLALERLRRAGPGASDVADLFAGRSWAPPPPPEPPPAAPAPPPPPVVAAPAAPVAPPLPFVYIGRMEEEGEPAVFYLERGVEVLTVAAGQAIDASYRLERAMNGQLEFTYVPLDARQYLRIGESQ